MNIDDIILNLSYEDMNINNYADIDNEINYKIIKKIFESYHVENKDIYFRFFPFYSILDGKDDIDKYKYNDEKNREYIGKFIEEITDKINNTNIDEIIKKKKKYR